MQPPHVNDVPLVQPPQASDIPLVQPPQAKEIVFVLPQLTAAVCGRLAPVRITASIRAERVMMVKFFIVLFFCIFLLPSHFNGTEIHADD